MVAAAIASTRQRNPSDPPAKRVKRSHDAHSTDVGSAAVGLERVLLQRRRDKRKITVSARTPALNGLKDRIDESRAVVRSNGDLDVQNRSMVVVEISSDDEDDSEEEEDDDDESEVEEDGEEEDREKEEESEAELESKSERRHANEAGGIGTREINPARSDNSGGEEDDEDFREALSDAHGDDEDDVRGLHIEAQDEQGDVTMEDESPGNDSRVSKDKPSSGQKTQQQDQDEPPSFGELLKAIGPEPIDVDATFANSTSDSRALVPTQPRAITAPTGASLGTVLTQALRTNDCELLESCLSLNDLDSVRSTIERLPSPLVADLLQRLAERIYRRPGRAGNLMVWVQWSLVSHGGYLASQPKVMKKLASLNRVIKERADGLQPLLRLKGKLDMLAAQLELRKGMRQTHAMHAGRKVDDDEERIIYVEGNDDHDDDGHDSDVARPQQQRSPAGRSAIGGQRQQTKGISLHDDDIGEPEETGDEMAVTVNGIHPSSEADDSDSEQEDNEDEDDEGNELIDDEAEETDKDTGDDISEDDFEESPEDFDAEDLTDESMVERNYDEDDVDIEDEDQSPPVKRSTVATKRRSGFSTQKRNN